MLLEQTGTYGVEADLEAQVACQVGTLHLAVFLSEAPNTDHAAIAVLDQCLKDTALIQIPACDMCLTIPPRVVAYLFYLTTKFEECASHFTLRNRQLRGQNSVLYNSIQMLEQMLQPATVAARDTVAARVTAAAALSVKLCLENEKLNIRNQTFCIRIQKLYQKLNPNTAASFRAPSAYNINMYRAEAIERHDYGISLVSELQSDTVSNLKLEHIIGQATEFEKYASRLGLENERITYKNRKLAGKVSLLYSRLKLKHDPLQRKTTGLQPKNSAL
jgi:hypothetical protein